MGGSENSEQGHADAEVEISDLDQPGNTERNRFPGPIRTPLSRWLLPGRRSWWQASIMGTLLLVLLVIIFCLNSGLISLITASLHSRLTPSSNVAHRSNSLTIPSTSAGAVSQQGGLVCLMDTTWSPDSKRLAVLGYQQDCAKDRIQPGLITVYDAHSGKHIEQLEPDSPILRVLHERFSGDAVIHYHNILWSPHGEHLAIIFVVTLGNSVLDGVLLIDTNGEHAQVLLQPETVSTLSYLSLVWDLERGKPARVAYLSPISSDFPINTPPALAYRWGAGGDLAPETPLTSTIVSPASPQEPVGNADGSTSFTIWQPGWAQLTTQYRNGPSHVPGVYTWQTYFAAWSMDEHYLAQSISLAARLNVAGQPLISHQTLVDFRMEHLPLLRVRDRALTRILKALNGTTAPTGFSEVAVAWRPDGRVLAVNDNLGASVDIYDCATGEQLASLHPNVNAPYLHGASAVLRWSPDGSHLLMSGSLWGPAALWSLNQLPK